jgi:hypothetical protein
MSKQQIVRKRIYKEFDVEGFLTDNYNSDMNTIVTGAKKKDTARYSVSNEEKPTKKFNFQCKEVKKAVPKDKTAFLKLDLMTEWTQQKPGEQLMRC